jgi:hypothetical protein
MDELAQPAQDITLVELLDRVVDHGVVLAGDITISVADVDLIYVGLRVLIRTPLENDTRETQLNGPEDCGDSDDSNLRLRDSAGGR